MGVNPPTNKPIKASFNYGRQILKDERSEPYFTELQHFQKRFKDLDHDGDVGDYVIHQNLGKITIKGDGNSVKQVSQLTITLPEVEGSDSAKALRYIVDGPDIYFVQSSLKEAKVIGLTGVEGQIREAWTDVASQTQNASKRKKVKIGSHEYALLTGLLDQGANDKTEKYTSDRYANMIRIALLDHIRGIALDLKKKSKLNATNLNKNEFIKKYKSDPYLKNFINKLAANTKELNKSNRVTSLQKIDIPNGHTKNLKVIQSTFSLTESVHFTDDINTANNSEAIRQNVEVAVKGLKFKEPDTSAKENFTISNRSHYGSIAEELVNSMGREFKTSSTKIALPEIQLSNSIDTSGNPTILVNVHFYKAYSTTEPRTVALTLRYSDSGIKSKATKRVMHGTDQDSTAFDKDEHQYFRNPGKDRTKLALYTKARATLDFPSDAQIDEPVDSSLMKARYLVSLLALYKDKNTNTKAYNQIRENISNIAKMHIIDIYKNQSQGSNNKILKAYSDIPGVEDFRAQIEKIGKKDELKFVQAKALVNTSFLENTNLHSGVKRAFKKFQKKISALDSTKANDKKMILLYNNVIEAIMKRPELANIFVSDSVRLGNTGADLEFYQLLNNNLSADSSKPLNQSNLLKTYRQLKLQLLTSK